ncbi:hypothetical protein [Ekhidna sp. To15]|uniref:hypothetical protein n=1 Tax=Ekhidna sp. To15 TaxID=3395267 RepID=UPI003F51EA04
MKTFFNTNAFRQVKWQTVVVVGLALTFGLNILFGRTSLREAKKLTQELELRIDTLQAVESEYIELEKKYVNLYAEFSNTRTQISEFKEKLATISKAQNNSLSNIRNELGQLVAAYDTIDVSIPPDTVNLDGLRF